jgi:hypothetical protein
MPKKQAKASRSTWRCWTQVAMLANLGANYLVSGNAPGRAGNAHQNIDALPGVWKWPPRPDGTKTT